MTKRRLALTDLVRRSVFIIGDSISIQYGTYLDAMLKGKINYSRKEGMEEAIHNLDYPEGANGGDSLMVYSYLKDQHSSGVNYDILLINCGLHDIKTNPKTLKKQVGEKFYKNNIKNIIKLGKSMSQKVIWINTTPVIDSLHNNLCNLFYRYNKDVDNYNDIADAIMKGEHVSIIDLNSLIKTIDYDKYIDHVHYNETIRKIQAEFIANFLLKNINFVG